MKTRDEIVKEFRKDMGVKDSYVLSVDENYFVDKLIEAYSLVKKSDSLPCVSICLTKDEESKQIEAISSIIKGLAKDNSTVAIGAATMRILNAFTRSINRC